MFDYSGIQIYDLEVRDEGSGGNGSSKQNRTQTRASRMKTKVSLLDHRFLSLSLSLSFILCPQDHLICSFFPFHMFEHLLVFSVIGPRLWNSLPPDTRNYPLCQYFVPGSKHTSSKLLFLGNLILDFLIYFMPYRIRHKVYKKKIKVLDTWL